MCLGYTLEFSIIWFFPLNLVQNILFLTIYTILLTKRTLKHSRQFAVCLPKAWNFAAPFFNVVRQIEPAQIQFNY